jgi:chitosanase
MEKVSLIKKFLLAMEQSATRIKYDSFYYFNDGPNDIKQITVSFGITEFGNLKKLVEKYLKMGGPVKGLESYLPKIGKEQLVTDYKFIELLKTACKDNVMIMCQEEAFNDYYINPAFEWCEKNKLVLPLSKFVICDSYLQSGSILPFLRNKFPETVPVNGGNEKIWVESYIDVRHEWLKTHSRKILNKTIYRTAFSKELIKKNDWKLDSKSYVLNGVFVEA